MKLSNGRIGSEVERLLGMDLTDEEVKAGLVATGIRLTGKIYDPRTCTWRVVDEWSVPVNVGGPRVSLPPKPVYEEICERLDNPNCTCEHFALSCPVDGHKAEAEQAVLEDIEIPFGAWHAYCDFCGRPTSTLITATQLWECDRCGDIGHGKAAKEPLWLRALRWLASL
jgi:hypothetical protein